MRRLLREIAQLLPELEGAAWAAVVVLRSGDTLMTPQAEAALKADAPRLSASGLRALCLCGQPPSELWIARGQFARIFDGQPVEFTVVRPEDEARRWALACLAEPAG